MQLGNQAAVLAISRLANYGLMLLSPVILVRLMSVEDFGRYREFVLYAGVLFSVAGFSFHDGLLYFLPTHPKSPSRVVWQAILLTAISSVIVVCALAAADLLSHGAVVGGFLLPLVIYTLLLVNFDFWEFFLIATHRSGLVLLYSGARLAGRMLAAVIAAAVSGGNLTIIIWSLIGVEAVRFVVSALVWIRLDRRASEPQVPNGLRAQLRFCIPTGLTSTLALLRRNLSSLAVAKLLGAVPLAHFAIGRYAEPIVNVARSSLTAVILPEMVRREGRQAQSALALWKRATIINCVMLFPVAVLIGRFAEPAIAVVFGPAYTPAAIVMQLYTLVMLRECLDFSPLLRSAGRTTGLVYANLAALIVGALALWWLIPIAGIAGAMASFVIASYVEVTGLLIAACIVNRVGLREVLPWSGIARVTLASALAGVVIIHGFWTEKLGFAGIILASAAYLALYAVLLALLKVTEAFRLVEWARRLFFARAAIRSN